MAIAVTTGRGSGNVDSAMGQHRGDVRHQKDLNQKEKESQRQAALKREEMAQRAKEAAAGRAQADRQMQFQNAAGNQKMMAGFQHDADMKNLDNRNAVAAAEGERDWQTKRWDREDLKAEAGRSRETAQSAYDDANSRYSEIMGGQYHPDAAAAIGGLRDRWNKIQEGYSNGLELDAFAQYKEIQGWMADATDPALGVHRIGDATNPLTPTWSGQMLPETEARRVDAQHKEQVYRERQDRINSADKAFNDMYGDYASSREAIKASGQSAIDAMNKIDWGTSEMRDDWFQGYRESNPQLYIDRQTAMMQEMQQFQPIIDKHKADMMARRYQKAAGGGGALSAEEVAENKLYGEGQGPLAQARAARPQAQAPQIAPQTYEQSPATAATEADNVLQQQWAEVLKKDLTDEGDAKRIALKDNLDSLEKSYREGEIDYKTFLEERQFRAGEVNGTDWESFAAPPKTGADGPMRTKVDPMTGQQVASGWLPGVSEADKNNYMNRFSVPVMQGDTILGYRTIDPTGQAPPTFEPVPQSEAASQKEKQEGAMRIKEMELKQKSFESAMSRDADVEKAVQSFFEKREQRQADREDKIMDRAAEQKGAIRDATLQREIGDEDTAQARAQESFDIIATTKSEMKPEEFVNAFEHSPGRVAKEGETVFRITNGVKQYWKKIGGQYVPVRTQQTDKSMHAVDRNYGQNQQTGKSMHAVDRNPQPRESESPGTSLRGTAPGFF